MTRRALPENEKRRTVAFTLPGKYIEQMDKYIEEFNARSPVPVMTRQNFLEGHIVNKLEEIVEKKSRS